MGEPRPPGMAGVDRHYPWRPDPKDLYKAFIANAEFYGLPVGMLKVVGAKYSFNGTANAGPLSGQHANTWTNSMYLDNSTYVSLADLDVELPMGEATSLQTAYHESTHAFFDLKENEAPFRKFIEDGVKYYEKAPMTGGGVSRDPERVFQEAVASYVGGRVATWWLAFEMLNALQSKTDADDEKKKRIKVLALKTKREYNDAMKARVYGYEEKAWYSSDQVETLKPITESMKNFLDHQILEDKIPDSFSAVTRFDQMLSALLQ